MATIAFGKISYERSLSIRCVVVNAGKHQRGELRDAPPLRGLGVSGSGRQGKYKHCRKGPRSRDDQESWIGSTASDSQPDTAAASSSTTWRQFIQKSEALEQVDK
ncbi:hypothetical protein F6X40_02635 [Paraburkholderia sp. UCT31]|uniref:hypothetical protein n=1 Tax=Paraburkholderia sp. UCT31 TaxID=2615209 RepID=UPI001654E471|nr:hypothetical protein [Paraburkholderia sp. UCT31]MBC8735759.1 hypothetical protein [Paraburkholderia sp. UCT31]